MAPPKFRRGIVSQCAFGGGNDNDKHLVGLRLDTGIHRRFINSTNISVAWTVENLTMRKFGN